MILHNDETGEVDAECDRCHEPMIPTVSVEGDKVHRDFDGRLMTIMLADFRFEVHLCHACSAKLRLAGIDKLIALQE